MSEYIERKATIKRIEEIPAHFDSSDIKYGIELALQEIKDVPTADVVEVVRCKNCKHFRFLDSLNMYGKCSQAHIRIVKPYGFCSYGERKNKE